MKNNFLFDFAPINTGFAPNGIYDDRILKFHELRSGNHIASSYIGNIATSKSSVTNSSTAFFCKENIRSLTNLAKLISANGSIPAIQIGSRISARKPRQEWSSNIARHVAFSSLELTSLSTCDIQKEIDLLLDIARRLGDCGFLVVQLHAAHGYFFSRLFNRVVNKRADKFAFGEFDWLLNSLSKFRLTSTSDLEIRLNIKDGIEESNQELIYKKKVIGTIAEIGFKRISLTNGFYDINKSLIYPTAISHSDTSLSFATEIANEYNQCTFSVAGNILNSITPNSNIPENLVIALGRPLIADPFAVKNFWNNSDQICNFCGECHYFSKGLGSLTCPRPTSNL